MFQANRLNLARLRRGLNKTQLAAAAQLTPGTIAFYEKGTTAPSDEVAERLAAALHFPLGFFYAELVDPVPIDGASFRALSRMTASQRGQATAMGQFCVELNAWIEARFHLPDIDIPDLDPLVATPAAAAGITRAKWGLGESPIPHVLHLLESRGVRVFSLIGECREVGAFSFWLGHPFVCLGTDKTPERSIFDMAHELGHLVLHRGTASPRGRDAERQADLFAANFLMPEADVKAATPGLRNPDLGTLVEAKTRWRVSVAALNYRLHELGMISDWHYRELCIEISRLGRHLEVNSLPREQSQIYPKVLASLRAEGISRAKIAAELQLEPEDLDALLAGLTFSTVDGGQEGGEAPHGPTLELVR
jgi:Zn-dependent peptidase ImmA (M78 family)/transcriptional regulator with XRE-family HTH domain